MQEYKKILKKWLAKFFAIINRPYKLLGTFRIILHIAFSAFRPLRPIFRHVAAPFKPRLGNLNQYAPRPMVPPRVIPKTQSSTIFPKISLITPSFKQGNFIENTITSVLNQEYPNLEYFIQDGGSQDETISILKKFEAKLTGWVSEKDTGQSQAINRGFARTTGEIMAWLNSDDCSCRAP